MLRTLSLIGLGWALAASQAHAWGWTQPIPIKVDAQFTYRFNVNIGPGNVFRPPHPWWAYFPADAAQQTQQPLMPFPNWPQQPPVAPPLMTQPAPLMTQGYAPWAGHTAWNQPVANPWQVQPISYTPMQAPAYWYGR